MVTCELCPYVQSKRDKEYIPSTTGMQQEMTINVIQLVSPGPCGRQVLSWERPRSSAITPPSWQHCEEDSSNPWELSHQAFGC